MKKVFLLIALASCLTNSNSQLRIALLGGGHTASVNETNDLPDWNQLKNKYTSRTGVHFGFLADLQLGVKSRFHMQPAVIFTNKGRKFSNTYDTSVYAYSQIDAEQFVNYIEVPINVAYKVPVGKSTRFFAAAGPLVSFFYNGREKTSTYLKTGTVSTVEEKDLPVGDAPGKYQTLDLGLNASLGMEFKRVFISANYSRSLTDFYTANYDGSFKHQVIGATLGVFIGKPVPIEARVRDRDDDGILDNADSCFDEAGPIITNGCPDGDADGVADAKDKCPEEKGLIRYDGCPVTDTDGDGIGDADDECKDVAGVEKYKGCPIPDTDGDGLNDDMDKCPTSPGLARYEGCPIPDRDKDRVNDEEDRCPDQPGIAENNGCPEIKKETVQQVEYAARRIQFEVLKADLLPESKPVLDEVATLLKEHPELLLDIDGHTSNEGAFQANMKLSVQRAETVKRYLVSKGIDENRLKATGYGPTRPVNEGRTEPERSLNRRVELKLRNN